MFNSKKELAEALLKGRIFDYQGKNLYFDSDFEVPFRYGASPLHGVWSFYNKVTEIKEWYEDIPEQGILCWVWGDGALKTAAIIKAYHKGSFHINDYESWSYATPMLKEDAMLYVLEK